MCLLSNNIIGITRTHPPKGAGWTNMYTCKAARTERTGSFAELMGRGCRSKETGLLISPSFFCLLENNHSLPSNILSIRRNRSSPYTTADRSHCREHWSVNRIRFQHPPPPHTHAHIFSSAQSHVLMETDAIQYVIPGVENV